MTNLRFDGDYVLVDVDASASQKDGPHAKPEDIRFGLYGALAHPIEANALGGCKDVTSLALQPLSAPTPDRLDRHSLSGPACATSPRCAVSTCTRRESGSRTTAAAYPAAFPVGVLPTNENDTGLMLKTTSVDAFRADGAQLDPSAMGDPTAFSGNGYMLLGLEIDGLAARYRDDSAPPRRPDDGAGRADAARPGLSHACDIYGASVLVLPDASLRRRPGPRVAVHAGRNQRGAALCDGVARRHPRRIVDDPMTETPGPHRMGRDAPASARGKARSPDDPRYDPALLRDGDTRNVVDAYRYWTRDAIIADIDERRHPLHIAIENFGNDANIGARGADRQRVRRRHRAHRRPPTLEPARRHGDRSLPAPAPPRHAPPNC